MDRRPPSMRRRPSLAKANRRTTRVVSPSTQSNGGIFSDRPAAAMNPSSSTNVPFQELQRCDGDGCISPVETWPLHHVHRSRGERGRLCSSCLLLSHRSTYCCFCLLLIPDALPGVRYGGDGDLHVAAPSPTTACQVCREAVAHLACLHHPGCVAFLCPACSAAAEGKPFTYAPPCGAPLDERGAKVILLSARLALALLQHSAGEARAEADKRTQIAFEARRTASRAVAAALEYEREEPPPWTDDDVEPEMAPPVTEPPPVMEQPPVREQPRVIVLALPAPRRLDLGESSGARVRNAPRVLQPRHANAMPPPPARRQRYRRQPPPAQPRSNARSAPAQQPHNAMPPPAQQPRNAMPHPAQQPQLIEMPPLAALTIGATRDVTQLARAATEASLTIGTTRDVTQLARAATEAARYSLQPPTRTLPLFGVPDTATASSSRASSSWASSSRATLPPTTLQLFPVLNASSSRATQRTLQLFQDEVPDDED